MNSYVNFRISGISKISFDGNNSFIVGNDDLIKLVEFSQEGDNLSEIKFVLNESVQINEVIINTLFIKAQAYIVNICSTYRPTISNLSLEVQYVFNSNQEKKDKFKMNIKTNQTFEMPCTIKAHIDTFKNLFNTIAFSPETYDKYFFIFFCIAN